MKYSHDRFLRNLSLLGESPLRTINELVVRHGQRLCGHRADERLTPERALLQNAPAAAPAGGAQRVPGRLAEGCRRVAGQVRGTSRESGSHPEHTGRTGRPDRGTAGSRPVHRALEAPDRAETPEDHAGRSHPAGGEGPPGLREANVVEQQGEGGNAGETGRALRHRPGSVTVPSHKSDPVAASDTEVTLPITVTMQDGLSELIGCSLDRGRHGPDNQANLGDRLELNAMPIMGYRSIGRRALRNYRTSLRRAGIIPPSSRRSKLSNNVVWIGCAPTARPASPLGRLVHPRRQRALRRSRDPRTGTPTPSAPAAKSCLNPPLIRFGAARKGLPVAPDGRSAKESQRMGRNLRICDTCKSMRWAKVRSEANPSAGSLKVLRSTARTSPKVGPFSSHCVAASTGLSVVCDSRGCPRPLLELAVSIAVGVAERHAENGNRCHMEVDRLEILASPAASRLGRPTRSCRRIVRYCARHGPTISALDRISVPEASRPCFPPRLPKLAT